MSLDLPAVTPSDLARPSDGEATDVVAARVAAAHSVQRDRADCVNAGLTDAQLEKFAKPDDEGASLLSRAADALGLSARGYVRILRVARTLADIDGVDGVFRRHIAEAISFRRKESGVASGAPKPDQSIGGAAGNPSYSSV